MAHLLPQPQHLDAGQEEQQGREPEEADRCLLLGVIHLLPMVIQLLLTKVPVHMGFYNCVNILLVARCQILTTSTPPDHWCSGLCRRRRRLLLPAAMMGSSLSPSTQGLQNLFSDIFEDFQLLIFHERNKETDSQATYRRSLVTAGDVTSLLLALKIVIFAFLLLFSLKITENLLIDSKT